MKNYLSEESNLLNLFKEKQKDILPDNLNQRIEKNKSLIAGLDLQITDLEKKLTELVRQKEVLFTLNEAYEKALALK